MERQDKSEILRRIPAVGRILNSPRLLEMTARHPRTLILKAINQVLEDLRREIEAEGGLKDLSVLSVEGILGSVERRLKILDRSSLKPVINATGVVIHTNLGRSILAERVLQKLGVIAGAYGNLEYDLDNGKRGSRFVHVEGVLKDLTSAEAAAVVNNNAAAVLITLETLGKGREVIISRGQLVEIGGFFRIPEVMQRSGARIVEVGTTNKTHLKDYEQVIGPDTALILKVHQSNFHIVGYTEMVDTAELAQLGHKYGIPVVEDLGSGCLVDFSRYGLTREPTVQEVIAQGADLVTFSGDKLLGGPQAGIIVGKRHLVEAIRENQLSRALRIDKLTLLALEETLNIYRDEVAAIREIPTLRMICQTYRTLRAKAQRLIRMIGNPDGARFTLDATDGNSRVGGGALPFLAMPSRLVCLIPRDLSAAAIEERLRACDPPIITRVEKDQVLLDVRTIQDKELKTVARAIREISKN